MLHIAFPTFGGRRPLQPNPSTTIDQIYSILLKPSEPSSHEQPTALLEIAKLNRLVFQEALGGNPNCGYFLVELLAFVSKNRELLRRKNAAFRRYNIDWSRARATTSKQPALRKLIQAELRNHPQIGNMRKALDQNGKFQISRLKPMAVKIVAKLAALPPCGYFDIS